MCLHQNTIIHHGFQPQHQGGGAKRKPHQDPKVQSGYIQALDKMYPDVEECDSIRQKLSQYISGTGAFGSNAAHRDRGCYRSVCRIGLSSLKARLKLV
jgi:hypothetical protein